MVGSADKNKRGGQNYLLPPGNALRLWHLRSRRGITTAKELTWTADQAGSSQALTATFRRCANVGRSGAYGERARGVAGGRMLGHWGLCGGQRTWTGIRPRIWCWVATGTNKAGMLRRGWILQRYLDPTGDCRNFPISRDKLHRTKQRATFVPNRIPWAFVSVCLSASDRAMQARRAWVGLIDPLACSAFVSGCQAPSGLRDTAAAAVGGCCCEVWRCRFRPAVPNPFHGTKNPALSAFRRVRQQMAGRVLGLGARVPGCSR